MHTAINIDDISKVACSSRYHFQRVFHSLTGFTVTQYIKIADLPLPQRSWFQQTEE
ncbi:AraC family transcriptional regulator [Clostridium botulinum]|nr:AraC family transcriptional regulator [Clostridium botulinum]